MINIDYLQDPLLKPVAEKVLNETAVSEQDALVLLQTNDITGLGFIANYIREKYHGKKTFYGVNMNLNYTNICDLRCPICAFSKDKDDPDAYLYSIDEIKQRVKHAINFGVEEVHIVGGLHPELPLSYFEEMLSSIKEIKRDMHIVAFTAVEIDYFAQLNKLPVETVFARLIAAGLDAMPGGGAEVFAPEIRNVISPDKISGKRWLEVMRTAHSCGLKTNATLLYNHIEKNEDIVNHMSRIRSVQDETGGFKTFVPLLYHDENTGIKINKKMSTGYDDVRLFATARIFLHNIPHIKALWMYLGEKMAQVLLNFGADDIGATYHYEKVVHAAGARTPDYGTEDFLRRLITSADREPVRTTAGYGSPLSPRGGI